MRPKRASWYAAAVWLPLLLAVGCRPAVQWNGEEVVPAREAPELAGVNWDGGPFRLSEHRGKVIVVFFGYTYCPDVCPFTLAKMKKLHQQLGERAAEVAVVFVSVDPKRDSVAKLASYVPSFDARFFGLRLEPGEVETISEAFGLTVQYGQPESGPGSGTYYYVDHTGTYFVIDRNGRLRLEYPPNTTPETMLPDVERLLAEPAPAVQTVVSRSAAPQEPTPALEIRAPMATLVPDMAAVYFTVVNPGPRADRLLRVTTPTTSTAELHETLEQDGVMRMVAHPDGLEIPAGGQLELAPGGKHVMLMAPQLPADGATSLPLSLHFEHAGTIAVEVPVHEHAEEQTAQSGPHDHAEHHGGSTP